LILKEAPLIKGSPMATVKFYTLLRLKLGISEVDVEVDEIPLKELLYKVKEILNNDLIIQKTMDNDGKLSRGTNILVNGHNISSLERLDTIIRNDDVVGLFPIGGGG
jgi:molybdopterin synthase sulfur carrier subunit